MMDYVQFSFTPDEVKEAIEFYIENKLIINLDGMKLNESFLPSVYLTYNRKETPVEDSTMDYVEPADVPPAPAPLPINNPYNDDEVPF